jgi:signal peptidase II
MVGAAFVIGGGIGNLYDRIMFGSVTDFLHIDFVIFQTGIFNFADVSIMIGMAMIIAAAYVNRRPLAVTH